MARRAEGGLAALELLGAGSHRRRSVPSIWQTTTNANLETTEWLPTRRHWTEAAVEVKAEAEAEALAQHLAAPATAVDTAATIDTNTDTATAADTDTASKSELVEHAKRKGAPYIRFLPTSYYAQCNTYNLIDFNRLVYRISIYYKHI